MDDFPYQVMPEPSDEDYQSLKASIDASGVKIPVEIDEDGRILDGHTRVKICKELGIETWPTIIRYGLSEAEKRSHARELNSCRRNLKRKQRADLLKGQLRDTPDMSDRAIAGMLTVSHMTVAKHRRMLIAGGQIVHHEKRKGRDGVSQPAKRRPIKTQYVPEPENQRLYLDGAKAIRTIQQKRNRAVRLDLLNEISRRMPDGEVGELPRKKFPVILCDYAWPNVVYSEETGQDKGYPYPPMPLDEGMVLCAGDNSPALDAAVLFFWTTANRMDIAVDMIRAWGFDYKSQIIWNKMHQGTGRWVFDLHEVLIIATRGSIPAPIPGDQCPSVYFEKKSEHSRKPVYFAELIQELYPDIPKLEMFQRKQSLAPDDVRLNGQWQFWGNEAGISEEVA